MRLIAFLLTLLLTVSCAAPRVGAGIDPKGGETHLSEFQERLNSLGIPLTLPPGRAILVNIPHYELVAFEDGTPVLRSRIIVGTPANPTPRMDTHTSRVTFRPSWRPTPQMVASGEYPDRVRPPGEANPLGLAAVRLEPGLLVYLHDTNQRHLFERRTRALSHGCIRVERWTELIAWLLGKDAEWVRQMAEASPTKEVSTPTVPVLIRYLTVFPAADGTLLRYPDIYGLEKNRLRSANPPQETAARCSV